MGWSNSGFLLPNYFLSADDTKKEMEISRIVWFARLHHVLCAEYGSPLFLALVIWRNLRERCCVLFLFIFVA